MKRTSAVALLALAALAPPALAYAPQEPSADVDGGPTTSQPKLRIGVPYISTNTGQRHFLGAQKACEDHPSLAGQVELVELPYLTERNGETVLIEAIQSEDFDLILGPTDSGVFVRVAKQETKFGDKNIPVISSLVTADVPNEQTGWFFRTNVGVGRRSSAIYDFLDKHWVNSISVIYADTEFGRRAEQAFRPHLRGIQSDTYQALPFDPPNVRGAVRELLDSRPEAVGIFGGREDIVSCWRALRKMNTSGTPYRPLLFTLIDIRSVTADLDDIYFVSVVRRPPATDPDPDPDAVHLVDDVEALSYDTTSLVLDEIAKVGVESFDRERLRDRFVNLLGGGVETPGELSEMRFGNMENSAPLRVYHVRNGSAVLIPDDHIGWTEKVAIKWRLMTDRFGLWPLGVTLVILLTVFATSVHDIYRWYGGSLWQLIRGDRLLSRHFLALVGLQAGVAIALFAFLGETGRIRYDSLLNGLVIALAPSPLLRANFARVGGHNIGFADTYDKILKGLTRGLLYGRYKKPEDHMLVLAYYNSLGHLKSTLLSIYNTLPNREEAERLLVRLETELDACQHHIDKRKLCAQRLMELRPWEQLDSLGCVPADMKVQPENVEKMISDAVRACMDDEELQKRLESKLQHNLKRAPDAVQTHYKNKLEEVSSDLRDRLFVNLQFLVMRFGCKHEELVALGFLEPKPETEQSAPLQEVDVPAGAADRRLAELTAPGSSPSGGTQAPAEPARASSRGEPTQPETKSSGGTPKKK